MSKTKEPWEFEKLGRKLAKKCDGLPLALAILGGYLYKNLNKQAWPAILLDWPATKNGERMQNILARMVQKNVRSTKWYSNIRKIKLPAKSSSEKRSKFHTHKCLLDYMSTRFCRFKYRIARKLSAVTLHLSFHYEN